MENPEEIFHALDDFSKRKPKVIPQELNDYLAFVARTGDPVFQWSLVKSLFKEKLLNVITDFHEATPGIEIPPYPNVDPFNYDIMKNSLLERFDSFASAPFTVQRICELLTYPRKQYNRVDKFMRAIEKNILVVSTREPGPQRQPEPENGDSLEPVVNGSDNNSEYNVDVEMEDMSWKENNEKTQQSMDSQPSSSESHISVDDMEVPVESKETSMDTIEKISTQYESVTPPEVNILVDEPEAKPSETPTTTEATEAPLVQETETPKEVEKNEEPKIDVEMTPEETSKDSLVIPEIKVDDAEMTEQRLNNESKVTDTPEKKIEAETVVAPDTKSQEASRLEENNTPEEECSPAETITETSAESTPRLSDPVPEPKMVCEFSASSEESSSSSENTDVSNSPKTDSDTNIDIQEDSSTDSNQCNTNTEVENKPPEPVKEPEPVGDTKIVEETSQLPQIQSENYSISNMKSEITESPAEKAEPPTDVQQPEEVPAPAIEPPEHKEEEKVETSETTTETNPE